jgi:hypothetical protein
MSFQSSLVFPFPAVQYIPLPITNLQQGSIHQPTPQNAAPKLIAGNDLITWESSLERDYGLKLSIGSASPGGAIPGETGFSSVYSNRTCPFLAINIKVMIAKYRGFFITMLGDYAAGQYQLFSIPTQRLYKSKLMIELFDQASGKRLVHQNLFWPPESYQVASKRGSTK